MKTYQDFLDASHQLHSGEIDVLLRLTDLVQSLVAAEDYETVGKMIVQALAEESFDAVDWILGVLDEEFAKATDVPCVPLGRTVPNFDGLLQILQSDLTPKENYVEKIPDKNGEIESFFNVSLYRTRFAHTDLLQSENFDTRDNDFICYSLQKKK